MVIPIDVLFPRLGDSSYRITSPSTKDYNCIAWAAADSQQWWWPDPDPNNDAPHWPKGIAREETLAAFLAAFGTLGYVPCVGEEIEPGFEKVALFADADNIPTHAARQLLGGSWTSKIGRREDIEHALHDLEGEAYGVVVQILKRSLPATTATTM